MQRAAVNWTREQSRVIESRGKNLLVSAAAGSGKTAVLVERIIRMVTEGENPAGIDELLVMTFTNAAAAEMRERIAAKTLEGMVLSQPLSRGAIIRAEIKGGSEEWPSSDAGHTGPSCPDHHDRQFLPECDPGALSFAGPGSGIPHR